MNIYYEKITIVDNITLHLITTHYTILYLLYIFI